MINPPLSNLIDVDTIIQIVNSLGAASVKDLSARFKMTEDSIRKDLTLLQKRGLLRKTYGGAMRIEDDSQVHFVSQRKGKYILDKQKIAKKVLSLFKDGKIIFLDISTSNIEVAKMLKTSGKALTVVTNMIEVMMIMADDNFNRLIFIGGEFTEGKDGFVGVAANREISKYRFDKSFMGVVGVNTERNAVTIYTPEDASTKETALKCSKKSYMLLETRKLANDANFVYAGVDDFTGVITEKPLEDWHRENLSPYNLEYI
ncbi:MAG: DeoR/GlpR transcriptional regulator [Quinella sp. 3Q1]|nr:DeoR/GlpR transcriptional regulator [Quinella sp. 3Q1]